MTMTFEEVAKVVANGFQEVMTEEGFNTFNEMKNCYWWTSEDIKEEVRWYLNDLTKKVAGLTSICLSDDGADVYINADCISYRKFSAMWHKMLK